MGYFMAKGKEWKSERRKEKNKEQGRKGQQG